MIKETKHADIAVIGAGIVGLAIAYTAAMQGKKVVVFERTPKALGASIRNFGLLWPVGQPKGFLYDRALRSREIWDELALNAGFWKKDNGSLHLAYNVDELAVLEEYYEKDKKYNGNIKLLNKSQLLSQSTAIKPEGLLGGLLSTTEATVDPREAIFKIALYLQNTLNVEFRYQTAVTEISYPKITTMDEIWETNHIYVCSGADFETLYPSYFKESGITKCKLQMMRTMPVSSEWKFGPSICGGLTLTHYSSFKDCNSLKALKERFEQENPEFIEYGVHVMITQNGLGELVIGDSHEYGLAPEPFDKEYINQVILKYLTTFTNIPNLQIAERWHGIYPKLEGKTELILQPEKGVTIVNGLGGAGMTLSFGLAEEIVSTYSNVISV